MLTCKVGSKIINSFDSGYDRYTLKQWSEKGILKCPVCNGEYEYCHGEVVDPYFRHKTKDCSGYYSEAETEEHKQGKILLYNWLKDQVGIENLQLEAWIPETKQRPDIYFEQDGKRYVIEFQCTPIASEFIKRRELYKPNDIIDIWILGTRKYKLNINESTGLVTSLTNRIKTIEKNNDKSGIFYLDIGTEEIIIRGWLFQKYSKFSSLDKNTKRYVSRYYKLNAKKFRNLKYSYNISDEFHRFGIKDMVLSKGFIRIKSKIITEYNWSEKKIINSYWSYLNNKKNKKYKQSIEEIINQINNEPDSFRINPSRLFLLGSLEEGSICTVFFDSKGHSYEFLVKTNSIIFGVKKTGVFKEIVSESFYNEWFREWEGDEVYTFIKNNYIETSSKEKLSV